MATEKPRPVDGRPVQTFTVSLWVTDGYISPRAVARALAARLIDPKTESVYVVRHGRPDEVRPDALVGQPIPDVEERDVRT